jgi:Carboxypeptidase regulatory-like domain
MNTINKGLSLLIAAALCISSTGCKKNDDTSGGDAAPVNSTISGKVHSPTGKLIGAAEIIAGNYKTKSDKNGDFSLPVAAGTYQLIIQTGGGNVFKTTVSCTATANQNTALTYSQTKLNQVGNMAYIAGTWDKIETIINDSLGYMAVPITVADLDSTSTLETYDVIFMNCGALNTDHMDSLRYANLNWFMQNGGSIYASDYAVEFLTGDGYYRQANSSTQWAFRNSNHTASGLQVLSTCSTADLGGFIQDSSLCTSKIGSSGIIANAHISDANLVVLLGKDSIDIDYNLGSWERIGLLDAPFTSIINDPMTNEPLAATTDFNGNYPGGKIFYTTFHNEAQGVISSDVQNILQYFILNL